MIVYSDTRIIATDLKQGLETEYKFNVMPTSCMGVAIASIGDSCTRVRFTSHMWQSHVEKEHYSYLISDIF